MKPLKKIFIKTVCLVLLCSFLVFSPLQAQKAEAWSAFAAALYKQMLENLQRIIDGIVMASLKQAAIRVLNDEINRLIGGDSLEETRFIVDWEDYLVKQPEEKAKIYLNDYLTQITGGRGSYSRYINDGDRYYFDDGENEIYSTAPTDRFIKIAKAQGLSEEEIQARLNEEGGSYVSRLIEMAKKATVDKEEPKYTYEGEPEDMFSEGNFRKFNLFMEGINNPWSFVDNAERVYAAKLEEEKRIAETKAIAYKGFIGSGEKEGDGLITMPGSLIEDITASTQTLGNQVIAGATYPQEILTALVQQLISQAIEYGLGNVRNYIDRKLGNENVAF